MRNLKQIFLLSLQNLFNQKKFYAFLFFNIFTGLIGFFAVQVFQSSLAIDLKNKAQSTLTADFAVITNYKVTTDQTLDFEKQLIYSEKSSLVEFFAMIQFGDRSRLVSVKSFSESYPLYGEIGSQEKNIQFESKDIWMDPELVEFLRLSSESEIKIGDLSFSNFHPISKDTTRFLRGSGFAPVVYFSQKLLQSSQLIQSGSTLRNYLLFKVQNKVDIEKSMSQFYLQFKDPSIRFETAIESSEKNNTAFKYFSDYLGLVSIVSMALSFLSANYLIRWVFAKNKINIAIFKTLGLSQNKIVLIELIPILLTSFLCWLNSAVVVFITSPYLSQLLKNLKIPLELKLENSVLLFTFLISIFLPLLMFVPIAQLIKNVRPNDLLLNLNSALKAKNRNLNNIIWFTFVILTFWLISLYQSKSLIISTFFTSSLLGISLFLIFVITISKNSINLLVLKFQNKLSWPTIYGMRALLQKTTTYTTIIVTFCLSTVILTLLPHLQKSIQKEIQPDTSSQLPQVFLFDIQTSQLQGLAELIKNELNTKIDFIPLVRSRITRINDKAYDKVENKAQLTTREQDEEMRFRNRGVNLTYQSQLKQSETIIDGQWNSQKYTGSGLPEISLEKKYAERIGAKIGDSMTFDVQGLEIKAVVTSLRSVRWTSFNPNFFILFQPGVLEEAPQNYLASLYTKVDFAKFQNAVVKNFPNVSIVDVRNTIKEVLVFVNQMSLALKFMALISMLLGLMILFITTVTQIAEQIKEFNLLKTIGANLTSIKKTVYIQFLIITLFSVILGSIFGLIFSYFMTQVLFNISFSPDYYAIFQLILILIISVFTIISVVTRKLKTSTPMDLIRQ